MQKFTRALFVVGALLGLSAATAPPVAAAEVENTKKVSIVAPVIVSSFHVVALTTSDLQVVEGITVPVGTDSVVRIDASPGTVAKFALDTGQTVAVEYVFADLNPPSTRILVRTSPAPGLARSSPISETSAWPAPSHAATHLNL